MTKDIELLKGLKGRLAANMVVESKRPLLDVNAINKYGKYIRALSNAIQMMEEVE